MVVKEQDRQVISTLIGGTVLGTGWFLIRLITTKATGQLDWNLVLFMAHFGIYVGLVFAPFWAKNLFRSLITLGAATIVVSVPVHYQVFSSAIARLDPIWPCFDTWFFSVKSSRLQCRSAMCGISRLVDTDYKRSVLHRNTIQKSRTARFTSFYLRFRLSSRVLYFGNTQYRIQVDYFAH